MSRSCLALVIVFCIAFLAPAVVSAQSTKSLEKTSSATASDPVVSLAFDANLSNGGSSSIAVEASRDLDFVKGLTGEALRVTGLAERAMHIPNEALGIDNAQDFSVQFWVRTNSTSEERFVLVSQKDFPDNSLASQKHAGWAFCLSSGTWAWNMGSGDRRIAYERDNGIHMPLNDGRWHQLTMTYSHNESTVRLFYDGRNQVLYNVNDSNGFDFSNAEPVVVGVNKKSAADDPAILPLIAKGAQQLQELVDRFNALGLKEPIADGDFMRLATDPERLIRQKVRELKELNDAANADSIQVLESVDLKPFVTLSRQLHRNPFTIHQSVDFMQVAPLIKLYSVVDGRVRINRNVADEFAQRERLHRPNFDIDNLAIWDRILSPQEVLDSYSAYFQPAPVGLPENSSSVTVASWNIHHGGKHETIEEDGWDSRMAIVEMIKRENIDIVMMQETYSSGDFIAAELGYYFATTVDWDYLNQGSNISVLSRFPIKNIDVPKDSPFMNVSARIGISQTQDVFAMSNWYGMNNFPDVADYHSAKFAETDRIPIFFAGDFNAVPHTDGGRSPASQRLLESGFVDAYRSHFPNVETHPGPTHRGGSRIDQLYFKGDGLKSFSTRVISRWPSRFPSDHFLIVSTFELDYTSIDVGESTGLSDAEFNRLHAELQPDFSAPWRTIPWKTSLLDAQAESAASDKPIFIWAMDGHPLGCT